MTSNKEKLLALAEPLTEMDSIKKQAQVIPANVNKISCLTNEVQTQPELLSEFKRTRAKENTRLYTSLSRLINISVYLMVLIASVMLCYWAYLRHSSVFGEYTPERLMRVQSLIDKLENIFTNLFTTALGFAGGVCKMFLKNNE